MQGLCKSTLLLPVLILLSNYAAAYGPDYGDWFINSYSKSWTEQWLDNDLSRRQMELAKSSGKDSDDDDDDEGDELFGGSMLFTGEGIYLGKSGQYSYQDDYGLHALKSRYPKSLHNISLDYFTKLFKKYQDSAKRHYNVPPNNLATGAVVLLAGGYSAYHNKPFPKEAIRPSVEQAKEILEDKADFVDVAYKYKLGLQQEIVGLGLHLQLVQAQMAKNPDPVVMAQIKQIGGNILRSTLGVDPERVDFTSAGMVFR